MGFTALILMITVSALEGYKNTRKKISKIKIRRRRKEMRKILIYKYKIFKTETQQRLDENAIPLLCACQIFFLLFTSNFKPAKGTKSFINLVFLLLNVPSDF